jgi:hypothetical protein
MEQNEKIAKIVETLKVDPEFEKEVRRSANLKDFNQILAMLRDRNVFATGPELMTALSLRQISINKSIAPTVSGPGLPVSDYRNDLQQGLVSVVQGIDRGYKRVLEMYTIAFYVGVLMILSSIYAALMMDSAKSAAILGGLGMAEVLASMIFRPAQEVQNSRGNLAQLQAAFFSWFNDVYNWNKYLVDLDREAEGRNAVPDFNLVSKVSEVQMQNISRMMDLIETYCETRAPTSAKSKIE